MTHFPSCFSRHNRNYSLLYEWPAEAVAMWPRVGYWPHEGGQMAMHLSEARVRLFMAGERAGKSLSSAMELLIRSLHGGLYWIVGPDYALCRAELEYFGDAALQLGLTDKSLISSPMRPGPATVETFFGAKIVTKSADDPTKLAMEAPDGILMTEIGLHPWESYLRCRGRIAQKRGWLLASGSFEGSTGWVPEKFLEWQGPNEEDAQSFCAPSWENLVDYPGGRDDPEIKRLEVGSDSPERFQERHGAFPVQPSGLVLREFKASSHVLPVKFDPKLPVSVWVDPGYFPSFYAVIAAQFDGDLINIIDEVYVQYSTHEEVITLCKQKPWWSRVERGACDFAGRQHGATKSTVEVWRNEARLILYNEPVHKNAGEDVLHGKLRHNALAGRPYLVVAPHCKGLIGEAGAGRPVQGSGMWRYKMAKDGSIVGRDSEDRYNHSWKAVIYGLVDKFGYTKREKVAKRVQWAVI